MSEVCAYVKIKSVGSIYGECSINNFATGAPAICYMTNYSKSEICSIALRHQRDTAVARADQAEAELSRLLAIEKAAMDFSAAMSLYLMQ